MAKISLEQAHIACPKYSKQKIWKQLVLFLNAIYRGQKNREDFFFAFNYNGSIPFLSFILSLNLHLCFIHIRTSVQNISHSISLFLHLAQLDLTLSANLGTYNIFPCIVMRWDSNPWSCNHVIVMACNATALRINYPKKPSPCLLLFFEHSLSRSFQFWKHFECHSFASISISDFGIPIIYLSASVNSSITSLLLFLTWIYFLSCNARKSCPVKVFEPRHYALKLSSIAATPKSPISVLILLLFICKCWFSHPVYCSFFYT